MFPSTFDLFLIIYYTINQQEEMSRKVSRVVRTLLLH